MKEKDTLFYKIVKPIVWFLIKLLYRPQVIGLNNINKEGRVLLAGNHTKWLDPVMIVGITNRQVHFLAKEELFHGLTKPIVKGMGCVPVNRKIHDKNALQSAYNYLNNDLCVGIFPEGTINRTDKTIMNFKIGAVKACNKTDTKLVPFVITGKYKLFRKGIKIEFLKPIKISDNLDKENKRLMDIVEKTIIKENNNG
ncbi:MAG: 1-acyl-sn-glycerol-3-phosphate acyltransferase [Bacilli bacterium]|nr:1-acyl-sn-glycerol-3-phosphate acyltransferase [Bacilli bacterium]